MELLKLLSTNELVAQVINFLLLLFFLRIFLWKRLLKVLDDRKARIASEFKAIEDTKKEVERLQKDYETKLISIETTAKEKVQEAQGQGQKIAEGIKKDAQLAAQKIIDSARTDITFEVAKAKEQLKNQIVDLAIQAAENVVGEKLTEDSDRKLVEEFIKEIDKKE